MSGEGEGVKVSVYEQVVNLLRDGYKQQDIAEELQLHKSSVSRYAQRAREDRILL